MVILDEAKMFTDAVALQPADLRLELGQSHRRPRLAEAALQHRIVGMMASELANEADFAVLDHNPRPS